MNKANYKIFVNFCWVTLLVIGLAGPSQADDKARKMMDQVFNKGSWNDMQGDVHLTMTNKSGGTKVRRTFAPRFSRSSAIF